MTHLTEETLNLFLDQALADPDALQAQSHLAACPECSARLAELALVFTRLETLIDPQLDLDLASGVLLRLQKPARLPRTVGWLTAGQTLAALAALAFAWPVLTTRLRLELPAGFSLSAAVQPLLALLAAWQTALQTGLQAADPAGLFAALPELGLPLAGLLAAAAVFALLALVANGLFLYPRSRRLR